MRFRTETKPKIDFTQSRIVPVADNGGLPLRDVDPTQEDLLNEDIRMRYMVTILSTKPTLAPLPSEPIKKQQKTG